MSSFHAGQDRPPLVGSSARSSYPKPSSPHYKLTITWGTQISWISTFRSQNDSPKPEVMETSPKARTQKILPGVWVDIFLQRSEAHCPPMGLSMFSNKAPPHYSIMLRVSPPYIAVYYKPSYGTPNLKKPRASGKPQVGARATDEISRSIPAP